MGEDAIAGDVRQFVADHIDSVMMLELLLLMHANPNRQWLSKEVATEMRADSGWVALELEELCRRRILVCHEGPERRYRYAPADQGVARALEALAKLYGTHRVSVIGMIFSKPVDKLRSFAEAFRFRRDKSDR